MNKTEEAKELIKNINTDEEVDEILGLLDKMVYMEGVERFPQLKDTLEESVPVHWEVHADGVDSRIRTTIEFESPVRYSDGY